MSSAMSRVPPALLALSLLIAGCGSAKAPGVGGPVRTVPAPAPEVAEAVPVGQSPSAVAVGFGAVWVASRDGGTVARFAAASGTPELTRGFPESLTTGTGPLAIATGEGAVWVAAADGTVTRIDPATNRAHPVARVPDPGGIAAGAGSVWVTSRSGGSVTRLDPDSGAVRGPAVRVGEAPADVAVGGGSVWVANSAAGTVSRLSAGSGEPDGEPIRVGKEQGQALALTYGRGAVWVAKTDTPGADPIAVVRIAADSGEVEGKPIRIPGGVPFDLAAGPEGVWATDAGSVLPGAARPPALRRIDPEAGALAGEPVPVGANPAGVALGGGVVWVVSAGDSTLTRVTPSSE